MNAHITWLAQKTINLDDQQILKVAIANVDQNAFVCRSKLQLPDDKNCFVQPALRLWHSEKTYNLIGDPAGNMLHNAFATSNLHADYLTLIYILHNC